MRRLFASVLGAALLAPSAAARAAATPAPLATPWPAREGCSSYEGADVTVDDRVRAVEWRGPGAASLVFDVKPGTDDDRIEEYGTRSEGSDCHRDQTSCIVYRGPARLRHVRVARGSRLLPPDFAPRAYTELVLRDDVRSLKRPRGDRQLDFGLRLILRCADPMKTSVAWLCDATTCVPRTLRDNVKVQRLRRAEDAKPRGERRSVAVVDGPYARKWAQFSEDFAASICNSRLAGFAEANQTAWRVSANVACTRDAKSPYPKVTAADPKPRILGLARDLLAELDLVAEEGCAGACSARVDELRAAARALGAARELHLTSARAVFDRGDSADPGYGAWPSLGWIARLAAPSGAAEVACAHHQILETHGLPDIHVCRLSIFADGRHLGDYFPDGTPGIELPDGGAVHLLEAGERASSRARERPRPADRRHRERACAVKLSQSLSTAGSLTKLVNNTRGYVLAAGGRRPSNLIRGRRDFVVRRAAVGPDVTLSRDERWSFPSVSGSILLRGVEEAPWQDDFVSRSFP